MKRIRILGTGCPKYAALRANAEAAVASLGIEAAVGKIDNIAEIVKFGSRLGPALHDR